MSSGLFADSASPRSYCPRVASIQPFPVASHPLSSAPIDPLKQEHYKFGGHKRACSVYVLASAVHAQHDRLCIKAYQTARCLICSDAPREPVRLPCGHTFCTPCIVELRAKGVSHTCPLCRSQLPPGSTRLFELGYRVWVKLRKRFTLGSVSGGAWRALTASSQKEMNDAVVMLHEAVDQVRNSQCASPSLNAWSARERVRCLSFSDHEPCCFPRRRVTLKRPVYWAVYITGPTEWRQTTNVPRQRTESVQTGVTRVVSGSWARYIWRVVVSTSTTRWR